MYEVIVLDYLVLLLLAYVTFTMPKGCLYIMRLPNGTRVLNDREYESFWRLQNSMEERRLQLERHIHRHGRYV